MPVTIPAVQVIRETVYLGRKNRIRLEIASYDHDDDGFDLVDFSTVTEWIVELIDQDDPSVDVGPFSTDDYPGIASSAAAGIVELELGGLSIDEGRYWLRLAVIDSADNDTQIIHEDGPLYRVLLTVSAA